MESKRQPDPIELKLPAEAESVSRARHALREYAARVGVDAEAVALAVSEAVSNAVLHAYREAKGMIAICAELVADGRLLVTVVDRGVGMKPRPHQGSLGMGLPLIGLVADSVEVSSRGETGVELRMRFRRNR